MQEGRTKNNNNNNENSTTMASQEELEDDDDNRGITSIITSNEMLKVGLKNNLQWDVCLQR